MKSANALKNIMASLDFDADGNLCLASLDALATAERLASQLAARLTLFHVVASKSEEHQVLSLQPQSALFKRVKLIENEMSLLEKKATVKNIHSKVVVGPRKRLMITQAVEQKQDLVVIGSSQHNAISTMFLGSTESRMLRYCPCPVLTVRKPNLSSDRKVMVAHDLSDAGDAAFKMGVAIARAEQAKLYVLHIIESPEESRFLGSITQEQLEQEEKQCREELEKEISSLGLDISPDLIVSRGSTHAVILEECKNLAIDTLCMGTVGRSGFSGIITGNTAENVLPWVKCSLVAVKPQSFSLPANL